MANQRILSPVMLQTYEQCKKKFFLRYVRNIVMPQPAVLFEKGKNIHALAGYYLTGVNIEKFEQSLSPGEFDIWQKLKANNYFKMEPVKSEFTINFRLENFWFGGRLDAIVKSGNRYYILDYKTGSAPKDAKYNYQTMVYLVAASKFLKEYESLAFVYIDLKNNENVIIDFSNGLNIEYEKILINTASKICSLSENKLPVNNNCKCEYAKICF